MSKKSVTASITWFIEFSHGLIPEGRYVDSVCFPRLTLFSESEEGRLLASSDFTHRPK
jgi:hypothetical protein